MLLKFKKGFIKIKYLNSLLIKSHFTLKKFYTVNDKKILYYPSPSDYIRILL